MFSKIHGVAIALFAPWLRVCHSKSSSWSAARD